MDKVTVVSPRGQLPPRQFVPMAPRLDSLDGKVIYIVDIRWSYTGQFTEELAKVLSERYPGTTFVRRDKAGPYGESDPQLWEEIKKKGDGTILATGH
ncbi:MAG: hypothetical protein ABSD38_15475 [Syntrophorhabdales bacterium]